MAIDDKTDKLLTQLAEDLSNSPHEVVLRAALTGILANIGPLGAVIDTLLFGTLRRTTLLRRLVELLKEIKLEQDRVAAQKLDLEFFRTEEFQTLFTLAVQQLQTAHDRAKIKLLASALVNSGIPELGITAESREVFLRCVQALSVSQIKTLNAMYAELDLGLFPKVVRDEEKALRYVREVKNPRGEELLNLQVLSSMGLVEETFESLGIIPDPSHKLAFTRKLKQIGKAPHRTFRISDTGIKLLKFIGQSD